MKSQVYFNEAITLACMDDLTFGEWIEDQYKGRGWTQKYFASQIGVGSSAVSNWVTGRALPEEPICDDIAMVLGVDRNEVRRRAGREQVRYSDERSTPEEALDLRTMADRIAGLEEAVDRLIAELRREREQE